MKPMNQHKLKNELERIRREQNALLVLIIKPDWGYVDVDPKLAVKNAIETLRNEIPAIESYLRKKKSEAR
jgi:hypothetical protein